MQRQKDEMLNVSNDDRGEGGKSLVEKKSAHVGALRRNESQLMADLDSGGGVKQIISVGKGEAASVAVEKFTPPKSKPVAERKCEDEKENGCDFSCKWSPDQKGSCVDRMRKRLPPPRLRPRRWLFFGDSTVWQLFTHSNLVKTLVTSPHKRLNDDCHAQSLACERKMGGRCNLNDPFDLPYPEKWSPPNSTSSARGDLRFAGPVAHGASNPYCSDCNGCNTNFLKCVLRKNVATGKCDASKNEFTYGGYISMEFARDVEMQTPEFVTTQENLAAYIDRVWNTPDMIQEWGKPICVISAGIHDVAIVELPLADYVKNVNFLLTNFLSVCEHIIWLGNTAPRNDDSHHRQKVGIMRTWDDAVRGVIDKEAKFSDRMSFIDVYDASLKRHHIDHIHMGGQWYQQLGNNLLVPLVQMGGLG